MKKNNSKSRLIKINGLVEPHDINDQGKAISLKLLAQGEEEYIIDGSKTDANIWNHIGQIIEAHCEVTEGEGGLKVISINDFSVLDT